MTVKQGQWTQLNDLRRIISFVVLIGVLSLVAGCGLLLDQLSASSDPAEDSFMVPDMIVAQTADAAFTKASSSEKRVKLSKLMRNPAFRQLKQRLERDNGWKVYTERAQAFKIHHKRSAQGSHVATFDTTTDDGTLLLVPVGEGDQGYIADVSYQDQDNIWAETYDGGNLDYLDDEGDELSFIYPELEIKQQFLDELQLDADYQEFLGQLSAAGLSLENVQVIFDPDSMEAYLTVDAVQPSTSSAGVARGQVVAGNSISAGRYAMRKPLSSLQNRDGNMQSSPTNPVVASPASAAPTVIGRPVDVLADTLAGGKQYCLLQGGYTSGSSVYGRAGCFSESLKNYQGLRMNPLSYFALSGDNASFLTGLSQQQNPTARPSSLYITGEDVLIYGLANPTPTQIQILLNYAKAIRTGTVSSASTLAGFVLQEEEDSDVTASHLFGTCSVVTNQIFLGTLIAHHGDLQAIKNDIKNWEPVKKLLENREIDASSIDAFVSALAAFVKAGLSIGFDDVNLNRNFDFLAGIHQLCHTLDVFATDKVNFTDAEISGAIADLATIIASLANCVASQLARVCTGSKAKDTMAAFLRGLPDGRVPEMRALLVWLRVGAALVNTGNQVVLSILKNTALS